MICLPEVEQDVENYIDGVLSGEIVAGRLVKLACQRHRHDLEHAWERGFVFDRDIATRACMFFPLVCRHSIGEWDGQPFNLSPWQKFVVWCIFGWRKIDTKTRRFSCAYISVARKNGKTSVLAALALLLMYADEPFEPGAEIYVAATKERQAHIMYREACRIVKSSPTLSKIARIRSAPHGIHYEAHNSSFAPLGSDSQTTDGLNIHGSLMDEIHEWGERHRGLKDKLETGTGSRRQPLQVMITTAGTDHSQIWIEEDGYGERVLESVVTGNILDDSRFVYIARIDEEDDPLDEKCWPKANPNLGISAKVEKIQEFANKAKSQPTALSVLTRYYCNRRVGSTERAISLDAWMKGKDAVEIDDGAYGHGGLDIGRSDDWCAISAVFPMEIADVEEEVDGEKKTVRRATRWEIISKAWCCKEGDFRIDREPFRRWIAEGRLVAHEGNQVDFAEVVDEIVSWSAKYNLLTWAYDPNHARLIASQLEQKHGIQMFSFAQFERFYNEPCIRFVQEMSAGNIRHGNDPVLEWQAGNLKYARSHGGLVKPDKSNNESKIDGMVATLMAFSECLFAEKNEASGNLFIS